MIRSCNYLVLVTETLIACDIAQIIAEFDTTAKVICAKSVAEAGDAVAALDSIEIAFIAGRPSSFGQTRLHSDLIHRGARIVMLGVEAENSGPTEIFDVLAMPFDTDAVLAKLRAGHTIIG